MLGMYTPVYTLVHPPGYTTVLPRSCRLAAAVTGEDGLTALTRGVAELHVTEEPLTVHHPFHCWNSLVTRFTVGRER